MWRSNTLVYTTRVHTGVKKREHRKARRFITFIVVQVTKCHCEVYVVTHSISVTIANEIYDCLVVVLGYINFVHQKRNEIAKVKIAPDHFIGRAPGGVS